MVKGDQFAAAELCYLAQAFRSLLRGTLGELELSLPEGLHLLGAAHEGEPDRIRRVSGTRAAEARCCAAAAAAKPDRRQPKVPAASPAFVLPHLQRLAVLVPSPISRRIARFRSVDCLDSNHKRVTLITLDARVRSLVPALGEVSHAVRQPG